MHELGLLAEIVDKIEAVAKENNVTEIEKLVLDVGEYSGVVPEYVETSYPAVIGGTMLENTKLQMNIIKGVAFCHSCKRSSTSKATNRDALIAARRNAKSSRAANSSSKKLLRDNPPRGKSARFALKRFQERNSTKKCPNKALFS